MIQSDIRSLQERARIMFTRTLILFDVSRRIKADLD